MNDAIRIAIEKGGYTNYPADWNVNEHFVAMSDDENRMALDPLFWQALGKALGWKLKNCDGTDPVQRCSHCNDISINCCEWLYHAHRYLDIKLTGGSEVKFWSDLLEDAQQKEAA